MQVSCGNCQLSFDAPEGASGLVCPICRGPLLPKSAQGQGQGQGDGASPAAKAAQDWSGGDLDDLIAMLSAPALSARVEVLGASGDNAVGEVHLLAGGVSDALYGGKSTDDALDKLRAGKPTRFRVEQRLPNPTDGDLTYPGPDSGTLESRALAHLMRYCEDYVISCVIEVWRGNENARVEYKRGEIGNVTVGGIDAPERLAEVMQWSSGNYRLIVQPLKLAAVAPKRPQAAAAAAKVPAPAPSAQAARHASATKTIFGMPAAEIIKARAAAEAAKAAAAAAAATPARTTSPASPAAPAAAPPAAAPPAAAPPAVSAAPPPAAAPVKTTPPGVAPSSVPAPMAASRASSASATKTIFGVPTPGSLGGFTPVTQPSPAPAAAPAAPAGDDRGKTGARKVSVPGPEVAAAPSAAADDPAATHHGYGSEPAAETPAKRTSTPVPAAAPRPAPAPAPAAAGGTERIRAPKRETPIWTYVGVGVTFGLALIAIYQLVGMLAH